MIAATPFDRFKQQRDRFVPLTLAYIAILLGSIIPRISFGEGGQEREECRTVEIKDAIDASVTLFQNKLFLRSLAVLRAIEAKTVSKLEPERPCAIIICAIFNLLRDRRHTEDFTIENAMAFELQSRGPTTYRELSEEYKLISQYVIKKYDVEQNLVNAAEKCKSLPADGSMGKDDVIVLQGMAKEFILNHAHTKQISANKAKLKNYLTAGGVISGLGALSLMSSGVLLGFHGKQISATGCPSPNGIDGPCSLDFKTGSIIGLVFGSVAIGGSIALFTLGCNFTKPKPYWCHNPIPPASYPDEPTGTSRASSSPETTNLQGKKR